MDRLPHIIETQQFTIPWLEEDFFPLVDAMEARLEKREKGLIGSPVRTDLTGKNVVEFFFGSSTRTMLTFQFATRELNAVNFDTDNAGISSSAFKGESLRDTLKIISGYPTVDAIALRTAITQGKEEMTLKEALPFSTKPIISAGDRNDQHPTQTLIDLYTIRKEMGKINGLTIGLLGDVGGSRTVRSLIYVAAKYSGTRFITVSPEMSRLPQDLKDYLQRHNVELQEVNDARKVASQMDVCYAVRLQTENNSKTGRALFSKYGPPAFWSVNQEVLNLLPKKSIILHPLPRNQTELPYETDNDPRARYFQQAIYGEPVRMAVLLTILIDPYRENFLQKTNPLVF